jgi:hypothetical protein
MRLIRFGSPAGAVTMGSRRPEELYLVAALPQCEVPFPLDDRNPRQAGDLGFECGRDRLELEMQRRITPGRNGGNRAWRGR